MDKEEIEKIIAALQESCILGIKAMAKLSKALTDAENSKSKRYGKTSNLFTIR